MRRVPIGDEPVGAHRPETVAGRLTSELATNVQHLARLETHMASTSWSDLLARLDTVVAAAGQGGDYLAQVEERVTALETALGVTTSDPGVDPNQPA